MGCLVSKSKDNEEGNKTPLIEKKGHASVEEKKDDMLGEVGRHIADFERVAQQSEEKAEVDMLVLSSTPVSQSVDSISSNPAIIRNTSVEEVELTRGREATVGEEAPAVAISAIEHLVLPINIETNLPVSVNLVEVLNRAVSSKDFIEIRSIITSNPAELESLTEIVWKDFINKTPDINKIVTLLEVVGGVEVEVVKSNFTSFLSEKISELVTSNSSLATRDATNIFFNLNQLFKVKKYKIDVLQQKLVEHYLQFEDRAVEKLQIKMPKAGGASGEESPWQQFLYYKQTPALVAIIASEKLPQKAIQQFSQEVCKTNDNEIIAACSQVIAESYPTCVNAFLAYAVNTNNIDLVSHFNERNFNTVNEAEIWTYTHARILRKIFRTDSDRKEKLKEIVKRGMEIIVGLLPMNEKDSGEESGLTGDLSKIFIWTKKYSMEIWDAPGEIIPPKIRVVFDTIKSDTGSTMSKFTAASGRSYMPYGAQMKSGASAYGAFREDKEENDESSVAGSVRCGAGGPPPERDSLDGSLNSDMIAALLTEGSEPVAVMGKIDATTDA